VSSCHAAGWIDLTACRCIGSSSRCGSSPSPLRFLLLLLRLAALVLLLRLTLFLGPAMSGRVRQPDNLCDTGRAAETNLQAQSALGGDPCTSCTGHDRHPSDT
jgi:hypothetical protein